MDNVKELCKIRKDYTNFLLHSNSDPVGLRSLCQARLSQRCFELRSTVKRNVLYWIKISNKVLFGSKGRSTSYYCILGFSPLRPLWLGDGSSVSTFFFSCDVRMANNWFPGINGVGALRKVLQVVRGHCLF